MGGDGQIAGCLVAEPGMKQQNYIAQTRCDHGGDAAMGQGGFEGSVAIGFTRCDHGGDAVMGGTPTMRCGSNYSAHLAVAYAVDGYNQTISDVAQAIRADKTDGDHVGMVMQKVATVLMDQGGSVMNIERNMVGTLRRETHGHEPLVHVPPMQVRRLTPTECERLQGFPDGYTKIPWRNKPAADCPDGPRYKALGNSWAVPCAAWIAQRLNKLTRFSERRDKWKT